MNPGISWMRRLSTVPSTRPPDLRSISTARATTGRLARPAWTTMTTPSTCAASEAASGESTTAGPSTTTQSNAPRAASSTDRIAAVEMSPLRLPSSVAGIAPRVGVQAPRHAHRADAGVEHREAMRVLREARRPPGVRVHEQDPRAAVRERLGELERHRGGALARLRAGGAHTDPAPAHRRGGADRGFDPG